MSEDARGGRDHFNCADEVLVTSKSTEVQGEESMRDDGSSRRVMLRESYDVFMFPKKVRNSSRSNQKVLEINLKSIHCDIEDNNVDSKPTTFLLH